MQRKEVFFIILLIFGISQIFAASCGDVNNDDTVDIVEMVKQG